MSSVTFVYRCVFVSCLYCANGVVGRCNFEGVHYIYGAKLHVLKHLRRLAYIFCQRSPGCMIMGNVTNGPSPNYNIKITIFYRRGEVEGMSMILDSW